MKIAIDATMVDNRPEGIGVYTWQICRRLITLKDDFTVFTGSSELKSSLRDGAKILHVTDALQPKYGAKGALLRLLWKQLVFPIRERAQARCDIVYNPSHYASLLMGKPQVITIHDVAPLFYPKRYRSQYYYFRFVLPALLKRSSAVIAISENTKKDLVEAYQYDPAKVHVVISGYDQESFNQSNVSQSTIKKYAQGKYILCVGASLSHKNIHRVLEALKILRSGIEHTLLIAGGKGAYREFLSSEVNRLGLNDRVKFLGYVPQQDLPSLYGGADMLVFASLYEGFGLPPLEAMACGCPVVVSNTSSLPEVCGDAAYYINPQSVEEIASAIYKVATDEDLRNDLRQKGLNRAKLFNWEKTAMGIYDVLQAVYEEGRK